MKSILFFLPILIMFSCHTKKECTTAAKSRFITLNFISIGEGTDYKTREKIDAYLTTFEKTNNAKLPLVIKPWGREGESKYCLNLSSLAAKKSDEFVAEIKKNIGTSKLVQFEEVEKCEE
jgi:hypothetical protein